MDYLEIGLKLTWTPSHHALTLACGGKLFLAPLDKDKIKVRHSLPIRLTTYLVSLRLTSDLESNRYWNWNRYDIYDKIRDVPLSIKRTNQCLCNRSGIWAMYVVHTFNRRCPSLPVSSDFADAFPGAEVIGTDISPIQPTWVPPNLSLYVSPSEDKRTE